MIKRIIKLVTPPIFVWLYKKSKHKANNPDTLFDGDDLLFKRTLQKARFYGEYGCGKSTKWVLDHTSARVLSIDTSQQWIGKCKTANETHKERLFLKHIDLGDVGDWGRPVGYSKKENLGAYTDFMWQQDSKPDVLLIDGRFRVCCFLTALKYADEGTSILFDDYTNRPHYHIVETYADCAEKCGRQALFIVPPADKINLDELEEAINNFRYVME